MPIKGLSESRRLPRLGKIHLGIKKSKVVDGREVEFPAAVDYFVFSEDNQLYDDLVKTFGEKPKELRILIPVDDEERFASQYYRCYSRTRGLICKGDGSTAIRMVDMRTGALASHDSAEVVMKEVPCQGRDCPDYEKQCREIMNLQFLLPEVPGLGIWQIDTSSINSIRNINSASELIKQIYGRVAMVPLLLTIEPQEVQDAEGKKRTVNVLNLRTNRTLLEMMETIAKPAAQMLTAPELPIPDDEVPEMVIPQVQEEKVAAPPKEEAKAKRKAPAKAEPAPAADPPATQEDKKEIVKIMRGDLHKTDEEIRETIYTVTGKKGDWTKSDMEKVLQAIQQSPEEVTAEENEVDAFIKEMES